MRLLKNRFDQRQPKGQIDKIDLFILYFCLKHFSVKLIFFTIFQSIHTFSSFYILHYTKNCYIKSKILKNNIIISNKIMNLNVPGIQ